jgi:hypothetical protein
MYKLKMKNILLILTAACSLIMSALTAHAEQTCDDAPTFYDKRFLQQCPRADIRKVPLDSNYARANYSDAEINAEILRRFRASQGNVEKDKNIRLLLSLDGYNHVPQIVIDSGREQFVVPATKEKAQFTIPASDEAIVAVIEITDIKEKFLAAYDAYQSALNLPPDKVQVETNETHRQVFNNLTHKMESDVNIREEPGTKIKEMTREEKIEAALMTMEKLGRRWVCLAYTTGLPDRIAEANAGTAAVAQM